MQCLKPASYSRAYVCCGLRSLTLQFGQLHLLVYSLLNLLSVINLKSFYFGIRVHLYRLLGVHSDFSFFLPYVFREKMNRVFAHDFETE